MRMLPAFALLIVAAPLGATELDLPRRAPGLWEDAMQIDALPGHTQRIQVCVDESVNDLLARQDMSACSKKSIHREADRLVFDTVCRVGGSTVSTHGSFSGDFERRYAGRVTATYDPPLNGRSGTDMRIESTRLGPCKPGQKPGDMSMPGMPGMPGVNLNEMLKRLPGGAPR